MKPRSLISVILAAAAVALPSIAHADDSDPTNYRPPPAPAEAPTKPADPMPDERFALHVAPALFMPFGALADATGAVGGALAGLDYRISSRFVLTFRGGYVSTFEKEQPVAGLTMKSSVDFAPFLGGLKWFLAEPNEGIFFAAEAGPVLAIGSTRIQGGAANVSVDVRGSGSQTNLGGAASFGYQTGSWDLRASLVSLDLGHADKSMGLMASASLAFAQF